MLPDLFKDNSRLISDKYNYNNDIDKVYSLLCGQIYKLEPTLKSLHPLPKHKDQCLHAADELEHLAKPCHVWEDDIEYSRPVATQ